MANVPFSESVFGRMLNTSLGMARPLRLATLGSSHMTTDHGFGYALHYALMRYHDANLIADHRRVLTSVSDDTVIANRGWWYATDTADTAHLIASQLPQFEADVDSGDYAYDLVATDFGLYNNAPGSQADLDACFADATDTILPAIFAKGVAAVIVYGTFGLNPTLCQSWTNMWLKYAESDKRIRYVDVARYVADPTNTSGTTWAWRGGTGSSTFGATSSDLAHLNTNGSRFAAIPLSFALQSLVPVTFYQGASFANATYDPANLRWGDLLGPARAMIGTGGYDGAGGGTLSTNMPTNWWIDSQPGTITRTSAIQAGGDGQKQIKVTLSGAVAAGNTLTVQNFGTGGSTTNNSDTARRYMAGIRVQLVGVTGLNEIIFQLGQQFAPNANYNTPSGAGDAADGLPNTTSEIWNIRSLFPQPVTGNNPAIHAVMQFRAATLAGDVILDNAWAREVI